MRATRTLVLAVVLGAAVGALSALYLRAVHLLEDALWSGTEPRLPVQPWLGTVIPAVVVGALLLADRAGAGRWSRRPGSGPPCCARRPVASCWRGA